MPRKYLYIALCALLASPLPATAGESGLAEDAERRLEAAPDSHALIHVTPRRDSYYDGQRADTAVARRPDNGLVLPDGRGGMLLMPGQSAHGVNAALLDARELKLKARELAAQLVGGLDPSLSEHIALPTTFVSQDDFSNSSSLGRYFAEQLYYEFNQRGLRAVEYRLKESLAVREDGEFLLSRQTRDTPLNKSTLYVVGTYYSDGQTLLINARLLRSGGEILRSGQLIMAMTPFTKRLLADSGRKIPSGSLKVLDFDAEARPPQVITAFDRGMDIH